MTARAAISLDASTRRAVAEWVRQGLAVKIEPDGTITVMPPPAVQVDTFDAIDMRAR